jgi:hypothetical protein
MFIQKEKERKQEEKTLTEDMKSKAALRQNLLNKAIEHDFSNSERLPAGREMCVGPNCASLYGKSYQK